MVDIAASVLAKLRNNFKVIPSTNICKRHILIVLNRLSQNY